MTYHFGIYAPPRPLLGEPTMQLPTNTCVDLNAVCVAARRFGTAAAATTTSCSPRVGRWRSRQSIGGDGHVFLCVRDPRKGSPMNLFDPAQIRTGGEMMILAIKARSGAIAVQPVDLAGDPYSFAQQSVSGQ